MNIDELIEICKTKCLTLKDFIDVGLPIYAEIDECADLKCYKDYTYQIGIGRKKMTSKQLYDYFLYDGRIIEDGKCKVYIRSMPKSIRQKLCLA